MKRYIKKCTISLLLCICIIASFFVGIHNVAFAGSLFTNGDFESGLWPLKSGGSLDTTVKHSGNKSAKIVADTSEQYLGTDLIPVDPNSLYELSLWIKTTDISTPDGVSVNVLMADANGQFLGLYGTRKLIKTGGTQDWTQYTVDVGYMSTNAVNLRLYVRVDGNITGTAWFDDVTLQPKAVQNKIVNPGFESGLWPLKSGGSIDTLVKYSGSQSAKLTPSTTEQYLGTDLIPVNMDQMYELSLWIKTTGISTPDGVSVNVMMTDSNGQYLGMVGTRKLIKTGGTQDWTRYTVDVGNFERLTANVRVYVRLDANITGTAWFDNVALQPEATDNMIANPSFETNWFLSQGGGYDTNVKHSGNQSAVLTGTTTDQYIGTGMIPVNSSESYELSAWIKTAGISTPDGASINVSMADASGKYLGFNNTLKIIKTGGTEDWTNYTAEVSNFAPGTAYIRVYVRVSANVAGTAWFDDFSLQKKKFIMGVNGPLGNIFSQEDPIKFDLSLNNRDVQPKTVSVNYSVSDYNNSTLTTGTFNATVNPLTNYVNGFDFTSLVSSLGVYTLEVSVTGDNGNINIDKLFPFSKVTASGTAMPDSIFGACTHFALSRGDIEKNLTLAAKAGVKWIRDEMYWSGAEKVKGQVTVLPVWDQYVDTAISKGIKPLVILDYGNPLYDGGKAPYTDEGIAAYANYVGTIAAHFKGKVDHFEIWNEWNLGSAGNPDKQPPEVYAKVLKAAYTAIKAANPDAVVVGGCTAGADVDWIKRVFAAGGTNYMDVLSIHLYSYPAGPETGGFVKNLQLVKSAMNQYGFAKPLWVTEAGWPTFDLTKGGVTELSSGAYLVRMYTEALGSGLADKIFWYDLQNDGVSTGNPEDNFGLIRSWQNETVPWSAKANYVAYSALTDKLAGADFVKSYMPDNQTQGYLFHRSSDNKDVLVLWNTQENRNVFLKLGTTSGAVYDMFGNRTDVATPDGTMTQAISPTPVYVEGNFSQGIEIINPYSMKILPVPETNGWNKWKIDMTINNNMSSTLSGKVKILDPLLWDGQEQTFTIGDNGSSVVSYEFPGVPEEKAYNLKIQITLDNGTCTILNRNISFLAANQAYKAPVIDGSISPEEWVGAMPFVLDQASQVQQISNWGGPVDLSAKGYVKWDKDHFYLALETKDNVHYQTGTAGDIWQGDGIQFAIDPGRKSDLQGLGYNEIGVALNSNTSNVVKWRWTAPKGKTTGVMNSMACQVKRDDSSGTTTYELSIPWSDLLPDGVTAAPDSDFGFSLLINDNDGSGRRGWIEYMSGIGLAKDTSAYGDMALASFPDLESVTMSVYKPILNPGETSAVSVSGLMNDGTQADLSKAQIVYTSDNEQVAKIDGSGTVTVIGEGTANVKASVTMGNITKEGSAKVIVDKTPPVTAAQIGGTLKNGWYSTDATVSLNVKDNLSGVAKTEYRIGTDGKWNIYTGPVVMNQEGTYTIQYHSTDKAGNVEDIKQQTIQIDKTPPDFNLIVNGNVLNDGGSFDDYLPLTFKVWDNLSGVASAQISVGGSVYAVDVKTQSSVVIDLAGKVGSYTVVITAEDIAGNKLEKNFTFTVTTSIDSVSHLIDRYVKAGDLEGPLADQITNNLNQAQHQLDIGRPEQAAKHMEDFIKHLNNEALSNNVKDYVKTILNADAEALIKLWSGKGR